MTDHTWIEWTAEDRKRGVCPVPPGTIGTVKWGGGIVTEAADIDLSTWLWGGPKVVRDGDRYITAYRITSPANYSAHTRITDQAAQIERQRIRIAALEAFVEEVATAKPEIISGRHPYDASGQSDVEDMVEASWFLDFQADAKRLMDVTPREVEGHPV